VREGSRPLDEPVRAEWSVGMRRWVLATSLVFALIACAAPDSERVDSAEPESRRYADPVEGGVLVRVVDTEGRPVSGAEVRVPAAGYDPSRVAEFLFASGIGRVDRHGAVWRTNEQGEVRVSEIARGRFVTATSGDQWGVSRAHLPRTVDRFVLGDSLESLPKPDASSAAEVSNERTIVVERDESIRVTCRDRDGLPGVGSIVMVTVEDPDGADRGETSWSDFVRASDGTLDVPHAQFWRALRAQGLEVKIFGGVLWSEEMGTDTSRPFPDPGVDEIAFEVSSRGFVDVRAEWCTPETMGDLRWIDGPTLEDDPDDLPELPINPSRALPFSVPLGQRYEIVVPVHGLADVRVVFDGPKRAGERVEVVLPPPGPSAQITGRLVSANGTALVRHHFEVYLERNGVRIEPEEFFLVTQDDGRFTFEVPPGDGGVLHVELTGSVMGPGPEFSATISLRNGPPDPRPSARVELTRELPAGVVEVGDIVCVLPR